MSVKDVEKAIEDVNKKTSEWEKVGLPVWREEQTRYGIIDPIISALGRDAVDSKECHPEYPRGETGKRVDYAVFGHLDMAELQEGDMPAPKVIIKSKRLGDRLDQHLDRLRKYVESEPRITRGLAVLTNGVEWRLYPVGKGGELARELQEEDMVDIKSQPQKTAQTLNRRLGRRSWRKPGVFR